MKPIFLTLSFLTLIFSLMTEGTAHAYLDPGTGSMVLQIAVGTFVAVAYTLRVYWKRIVSFFKKEKTNS